MSKKGTNQSFLTQDDPKNIEKNLNNVEEANDEDQDADQLQEQSDLARQREEQLAQERRDEMASEFEKYLTDSGIKVGFEIIFAEIIEKRVPQDQIFPYTIARLKHLAKEINESTHIQYD